MKKIIIPFASVMLVASCNKNNISDMSLTPSESIALKMETPSQINFTVPNLFPEGIVYDKFNNRFYVSSTTNGNIGIVTPDGSYKVFISDPSLTSTTGLEIDEARKLLYVSNSPGSVGVYDTKTGNRVRLVDLKSLLPGVSVFINDIALDPQGNAYVTNSLYPVIYKISVDGTASIFFQDDAFTTSPGGFDFNGIEYGNANGGYLLVAFSAGNQVIKIPVDSPASYSGVQLNAPLNGPDGLLLSNNGKDLVVVNNAGGSSDGKVLTFSSTNKWMSATLVNSFMTGPVFPTTATTDGKNVYVLYAHLNKRATGQSVFTIQQVPMEMNF